MIAAVILLEDLIHRINATNPLENAWARLERGEIDRDTFDAAFAAEVARMLPGDADGGDGAQLRGCTRINPLLRLCLRDEPA